MQVKHQFTDTQSCSDIENTNNVSKTERNLHDKN